jgi:hypothetical protein
LKSEVGQKHRCGAKDRYADVILLWNFIFDLAMARKRYDWKFRKKSNKFLKTGFKPNKKFSLKEF